MFSEVNSMSCATHKVDEDVSDGLIIVPVVNDTLKLVSDLHMNIVDWCDPAKY